MFIFSFRLHRIRRCFCCCASRCFCCCCCFSASTCSSPAGGVSEEAQVHAATAANEQFADTPRWKGVQWCRTVSSRAADRVGAAGTGVGSAAPVLVLRCRLLSLVLPICLLCLHCGDVQRRQKLRKTEMHKFSVRTHKSTLSRKHRTMNNPHGSNNIKG